MDNVLIFSSAQCEEDVSDEFVYKGDISPEEFERLQKFRLENKHREDSQMEKIEISGICKYCGTGKLTIETIQEQADLIVTNSCGCVGAIANRQLENALGKIEELFGKECIKFKLLPVTEEQYDILKDAAKSIAYDEFLNVTYSFGNGIKAKICKNAKDEIEIIRTNTSVIKRTT